MSADDTKARILDAAEKLFAAHGIEGTGLRLISRQAGVNLAAVNYHFGSKETLVRTVVSRLVLPLDRERDRLLAQAGAEIGSRDPGRVAAPTGKESSERLLDIVRAFVMPWVSFRRDHPQYVRVLAQIYAGRREKSRKNVLFRDLIRDTSRETYARFTRAAAEALPAVPRRVLLMRINLAVALAASFLFNPWVIEGLEALSGQRLDEKLLLDHLVRLIESGPPV